MVGKDATGYFVPVTAVATLTMIMVALVSVDMTGKTSGSVDGEAATGVFGFDIGTAGDALVQTDQGAIVYGIDDSTVGKTNGGGTRSAVGKLIRVEGGQAYVQFGLGDI
jgi:hypothetical protein